MSLIAGRSPESFYLWSKRMNDIAVRPEINLPSTFEDLSRFVLVGREKLVAVRAEIRAIDKVGLAKEVREQKLQEAQFISEAVLDAEVRIGEIMKAAPKATNQYKSASSSGGTTTKEQTIKEAGFTKTQVHRFETLADNPDLVEQAKTEARANDDIVSQSAVMNKIKEKKQAEKSAERQRCRKAIELTNTQQDFKKECTRERPKLKT